MRMKEDFEEGSQVRDILNLLRQQRQQVIEEKNLEAWHKQLRQELGQLFEEMGASREEIQQSMQRLEEEAVDPVARLEQLVAQGRTLRATGALEEVAEEMGLGD